MTMNGSLYTAFGGGGFGSAARQQPAAGAFGSSGAFGQAQPTTGGFGATTAAFGQTATATGGGFGQAAQPAAANGGAFGQAAFGGFGATPSGLGAGFGAAAAPSTTGFGSAFGASSGPAGGGGLFGSTTSSAPSATGGLFGGGGFGANTADSGVSISSGFGSSSSGASGVGLPVFGARPAGGFGNPSLASSGFGASSGSSGFGAGGFGAASTSNQPGTGHLPFQNTRYDDNKTMVQHTCITAMPEYAEKCQEELRWEDYQANRKGAGMAGGTVAGGFGQAQNTATSGGFGSTAGGFGSTATTSTPFGANTAQNTGQGAFGATTSAFGASAGTSAFGQAQQSTPFGAAPTTGGFGTPAAATTGFGASSTTGGAFGSSAGGFGSATPVASTGGFGSSAGAFGATPGGGFGQKAQNTATPGGFGALGGNTTTSAFGQATPAANTTASAFGQSAGVSAFGTPQPTTTSAFGASGFGQTAQQPQTGQTLGFNQSANTGAAGGGLFGKQPAAATGGFGTTASTGFGTPASSGFGSAFGSAGSAQPFGQTAQNQTGAGAVGSGGGGLFGATNSAPAATTTTGGGLFGQTAGGGATPQATPAFGASAPVQGAGAATGGIFSTPNKPAGGLGGSAFGAGATPGTGLGINTGQTPQASAFGGFGAASTQPSTQPQAQSTLQAQTTQTQPPAQATAGVFGTKPVTGTAPTAQPKTAGFGATTGQATSTLAGASTLSGGSGATTTTGGGVGGSSVSREELRKQSQLQQKHKEQQRVAKQNESKPQQYPFYAYTPPSTQKVRSCVRHYGEPDAISTAFWQGNQAQTPQKKTPASHLQLHPLSSHRKTQMELRVGANASTGKHKTQTAQAAASAHDSGGGEDEKAAPNTALKAERANGVGEGRDVAASKADRTGKDKVTGECTEGVTKNGRDQTQPETKSPSPTTTTTGKLSMASVANSLDGVARSNSHIPLAQTHKQGLQPAPGTGGLTTPIRARPHSAQAAKFFTPPPSVTNLDLDYVTGSLNVGGLGVPRGVHSISNPHLGVGMGVGVGAGAGKGSHRSKPNHVLFEITPGVDLHTKPSLAELQDMSLAQLTQVEDFTIISSEFGKIMFNRPVNVASLRELHRNAPLDAVVCFARKQVEVYECTEECGFSKPTPGSGLNLPARITLYDCYPKHNGDSRPAVQSFDPADKSRWECTLGKVCETVRAERSVFDWDTGRWSFDVVHFSREPEGEETEGNATKRESKAGV